MRQVCPWFLRVCKRERNGRADRHFAAAYPLAYLLAYLSDRKLIKWLPKRYVEEYTPNQKEYLWDTSTCPKSSSPLG